MTRYLAFLGLLIAAAGCQQTQNKTALDNAKEKAGTPFYSKLVADTFHLFISLPDGYDPKQEKRYPVVYLLDANLYFDIMATTINKYATVGLAPSVILVGIGYKDFVAMDSLRSRDYTYPAAVPEYGMTVSGGADKFLAFISRELIPYADSQYKTDTSKRILMGHSLGGYFTAYALLEDLSGRGGFNGYIAASPSLHYNNYYLLDRFDKMPKAKNRNKKINAYVTFGGLEESDQANEPGVIQQQELSVKLSEQLSLKQSGSLFYKLDIYSNLGHMDTQLPTFIKGLQWALSGDKQIP